MENICSRPSQSETVFPAMLFGSVIEKWPVLSGQVVAHGTHGLVTLGNADDNPLIDRAGIGPRQR